MTQDKYLNEAGHDSLEVGANNPIFGFLSGAMASSKAIADNGKLYDSIQNAVDNANSVVFVGPGTFNENVTITTNSLSITGAGYDTLLDGTGSGTGNALTIDASNTSITNLSIRNTDGGSANDCVATDTNATKGMIERVWIRDSDSRGIYISNGSDWIITNVRVNGSAGRGIRTDQPRTILSEIEGGSNVGSNLIGVESGADDSVVSNCVAHDTGNTGLNFDTPDCVVIGCRVHNANGNGIRFNSNAVDCLAANSRLSDSTDSDFAGTATSYVTDDLRTGSAN